MSALPQKLKASSFQDVILLTYCVQTTPVDQYPALLAVVYDLKLMRFSWPLRPLIWLIHKAKGRAGLLTFFSKMQERSPDDVTAFVKQTAQHIGTGKDREDANSVGGLSQREIDGLLANVQFTALAEARP